MTKDERQSGRFDSLDGMRGICAVIVLLYHCDAILNTGHFLNRGWLCVDAFFALSGFVIAYRYEAGLGAIGGLRKYLLSRWKRLAPTLVLGYLFSTGCFLFFCLNSPSVTRDLPLSVLLILFCLGLFLIPMSVASIRPLPVFQDRDYAFDPPLWSLFGEVVVNIAYGLFLYRLRSAVLLAIILLVWAALFGLALHSAMGWGTTEFWPRLGRALGGFLVGVLVFRSFRAGHLDISPSVNPLIVFSMWFFACCIPYKSPMLTLDSLIAIFVIPAALVLLVRTGYRTPAFFRWLGRISYPLYVSHYGMVWIVRAFLPAGVQRHSALWAVPMIGGSLCVAWAITGLAEVRGKKRLPELAADFGN